MPCAMISLPILPFLRLQVDGSVLVNVHVMPNAAKTQIQGLHDDALRVRLHAPPIEGRANLLLLTWMADMLEVPKSALSLERGTNARRKLLRVAARHAAQAQWSRLQATPAHTG